MGGIGGPRAPIADEATAGEVVPAPAASRPDAAEPDGASEMNWAMRRVILILTLVSTLNFVDRQIINILAEAIKVDLRLSDTEIGILTGFAFTIFYVLLSLPAARLAERYHRPRLLGAAVVIWSAFTMLCGMAQNFLQLALARMGVGFGESASSPTAHSLIADYVPETRRASALGLYQMGVPIGSMIGMAIGGVVVDHFGWRAALLLVGLPGLAVGLLVALFVPEPRAAKQDKVEKGKRPPLVPLGTFMRLLAAKPTAWLILAAASLSGMVTLGGYAFIASFFLRSFASELQDWAMAIEAALGIRVGPVTIVGVTFGVGSGLTASLGMYLGGRLADRHIKRNVAILLWIPTCAWLIGTPFAVMAMLSPILWLAFALQFASSLMTGAANPSLHAAWLGLVDAKSRATVTSVFMIVTTFVGLGFGPFLLGGLSDAFNHGLGYGSVDGLRYSKVALSLMMLPAAGIMALAALRLKRDYLA